MTNIVWKASWLEICTHKRRLAGLIPGLVLVKAYGPQDGVVVWPPPPTKRVKATDAGAGRAGPAHGGLARGRGRGRGRGRAGLPAALGDAPAPLALVDGPADSDKESSRGESRSEPDASSSTSSS
eukprot:7043470-Pyramimonas_sp.AAC.1